MVCPFTSSSVQRSLWALLMRIGELQSQVPLTMQNACERTHKKGRKSGRLQCLLLPCSISLRFRSVYVQGWHQQHVHSRITACNTTLHMQTNVKKTQDLPLLPQLINPTTFTAIYSTTVEYCNIPAQAEELRNNPQHSPNSRKCDI